MFLKHFILLMFFSVMWLLPAAQQKFREGYIVLNNHQKKVCLIRNSSNATESLTNYEYRLKDDDKIEKIELAKIEEFGVDNEFKFLRALIKIDVSPNKITHLKDTASGPEWDQGHAYLRVLVDGKSASLYSYYKGGKNIFFFRVGDSAIEPLVYKEYKLEITSGYVEQSLVNNTFHEQLRHYLSCEKTEDISKVSYTQKDLIKYFTSYQLCDDSAYVIPHIQIERGSLRLKAGTSFNTVQLDVKAMTDTWPKLIFEHENKWGFGAEAEYLFSFNNYKWSLFTEANYYAYHSNKVNVTEYNGSVIHYSTLEFPVGVTYYMNLVKEHRLFIRGGFVPHIIMDGSGLSFNTPVVYDLTAASRMMLGVGYNFNRLNAELRFYSPENITQNLYKRGSEFSQSSFRFSYTLFRTGK